MALVFLRGSGLDEEENGPFLGTLLLAHTAESDPQVQGPAPGLPTPLCVGTPSATQLFQACPRHGHVPRLSRRPVLCSPCQPPGSSCHGPSRALRVLWKRQREPPFWDLFSVSEDGVPSFQALKMRKILRKGVFSTASYILGPWGRM